MGRNVVTLILLLFSVQLFAQERTIKGTVKDQDGNPVEGAIVGVKGSEISTQTDINGKYEITIPSDDYTTLTYMHPDKQPASSTIGLYNQIDVEMSNLGEELLELSLEDLLNMEVVTISKSGEKMSDAPGVISVITNDEINRFGGITLLDILDRISGLTVSTNYFTDRSMISVRGDQVKNTASHVLYLINGRPIREILEGGISTELLETFPVNIIERIEVIKGPGSVLYGTNAFSGVVNIITRAPETNEVSLTTHGGWDGNYGANGNVNLTLGDIRITAAGKYYKKADWDVPYGYLPSDTGNSVTYNIEVPYEGMSGYFDINYKGLRFISSLHQFETECFVRGNFGTNVWKKYFNNLGFSKALSDIWHTDLNITYTPVTLKSSSYPFIERSSSDLTAEWTNVFSFSQKFRLISGGLFNQIDGKEIYYNADPHRTISDEKRSNFGIYTQADYRLHRTFKLIAGIQANKVQDVKLDIVPRTGIIWTPLPNINFKAIYSEAFRAPSINEVGLQHPALNGNPDLVPENVSTIDVSIGYQTGQTQIRANYFYSKQTNIIIADRSTEPGLYKNLGGFNISGYEFEGKYYLNRQLFLTGSFLYQSNEDQDGVENVSPVSNLSIKAGVSYQSERGYTVGFFNKYRGGFGDSFNTTLNPSPGAFNLMDVHAKFDLAQLLNMRLEKSLILFVQADNILDKEVWLPDWGGIPGESIPFNRGRTINIGLNLIL